MNSKRLYIITAILLLTTGAYSQQNIKKEFKKLEWLTGTWMRTNAKPGRATTESWIKESPGKLVGKGVTLKGTDTAFVEKLQLIIKDDAIFYVADVKENKSLVYFKLTSITTNSFVCENPEHDFPKKIAYTLTDGVLKAAISGNGKAIDYVFVKHGGK